MHHNYLIANSILWASAIIASAIVDAPTVLTTILLPVLAMVSLLVTGRKTRVKCGVDK